MTITLEVLFWNRQSHYCIEAKISLATHASRNLRLRTVVRKMPKNKNDKQNRPPLTSMPTDGPFEREYIDFLKLSKTTESFIGSSFFYAVD